METAETIARFALNKATPKDEELQGQILVWPLTQSVPNSVLEKQYGKELIKYDNLAELLEKDITYNKCYILSNNAGSGKPTTKEKISGWINDQKTLFYRSKNANPPAEFTMNIDDFPKTENGNIHVTTSKNIVYLYDRWADLRKAIETAYPRLRGRKPHNVIHECIDKLTDEGDVVIDPFCGSGVTIREGALLGRKCYGFDLNPAAVLISKVLLNPPSAEKFVEAFEKIYDKVYARLGFLYQTQDGKHVRYLAHRIIAKCECGETVLQTHCEKKGKKFFCPHCNKVVRFNLESLVDTEIFNVVIDGDKSYVPNKTEIDRQKDLSLYIDKTIDTSNYDFYFPENRRILAFKGIKTSSFFTARNYYILSLFANEIWSIENETIRDCALLLLTATVAQCSRLIANRNNLSTGGPAWSVPGFWIPQEHLESNPFVHIRARLSKFKKALETLEKSPAKVDAEIIKGNSLDLLNNDIFSDLKADLIFLDPPYGDSVPYTEFSNIWNSFLKSIPSSDEDISVSDRIEKTKAWNNYSDKLNQYMACFTQHLTKKGKLLITFNNNDIRAWYALIASLQNNGFVCRQVFYQIPAVISSKAQMSLNSSYISDVYSVYTHNPTEAPTQDFSPLLSHLCCVANARDGVLTKTTLDREFIISWLKNNIDHNLLSEKDSIINSTFEFNKKSGIYILKPEFKKNVPLLKNMVTEAMHKLIAHGSYPLLDSYLKINSVLQEFGTMELNEFKKYISDFAVENGKVYGCIQLSLF